MTDGYHEFIKDSTNSKHVNEFFSRKYIDIVTPKTYPYVSNGANEPKCPHGVPIPVTQNEVHANDSMIRELESKIKQSDTVYNKKGDHNQVQQTSATSKPVDTVAAQSSVTNTESLKASKVNEVTHSKALGAGAQLVTSVNKKGLSEVDGK